VVYGGVNRAELCAEAMVYETDGGIVTGLSLFSGGAIGEVVFKEIIPGYRTVGYVEIKTYCRDIIRARILR
jgi:hypothetical protein